MTEPFSTIGDLFNRKRITELERANANLNRRLQDHETINAEHAKQLAAARNQVDYLIRTIRDMDDKLFSISQCTGWESMRPRINSLIEEMTARKVIESKRIGALITSELHDTYKPESAALKKIGKRND